MKWKASRNVAFQHGNNAKRRKSAWCLCIPELSLSLVTSLPITNQGPWLAIREPLFTTATFKNVRIILGPFVKIPLPKRELALSVFRNVEQRRLILCRFSCDQNKPQKATHYFCPLWKSRWTLCHFWQLRVRVLKIYWQKWNCFSELLQ